MTQVDNTSIAAEGAVVDASSVSRSTTAAAVNSKKSSFGLGSLGPLVVLVGIVGIWYLVHFSLEEGRRFILPMPHVILNDGFIEGVSFGGLIDVFQTVASDLIPFASFEPADVDRDVVLVDGLLALWMTVKVSFVGLSVAASLAVFGAMIMSQSRLVEKAFFPYLVIVQAVPVLAIVPLIGVVFGFGFGSQVIVCVIISFFPIVANTLFGLKSAERGQHDLFALHSAGRVTKLRKLQIPAALPAFFTAMRIAAGLSVIGAIVGGFFFARGEKGLGSLLKTYSSRPSDTPELFATVILSSLLGIGVFLFFGWLGNRFIGKWSDQTV